MWYENNNLSYGIIKASIKNPQLFSRLMSLSSNYREMGVRILNNTKNKLGCKCNCEKNKEFKMIDEGRKLHCSGCADSIELNCWKRYDYNTTPVIRNNVCKQCFKDHWYNVMKRKMSLCIKESEE